MRFTPTPVVNPVLTHGQARVAKDFHPAPGDKPETVQREVPPRRTQKCKTQNAGGNCIATVPDAMLAYLLTQAAGRSADLVKCHNVAPVRKDLLKWLPTQPDCADWRIAFRTYALQRRADFSLPTTAQVIAARPPRTVVLDYPPPDGWKPEDKVGRDLNSQSSTLNMPSWLTRLRRQPQAA